MRHNQVIQGYESLHALAVEAVKRSGKTQAVIARDLGKTPGAIHRALKEPNSSFAALQGAIIEHCTSFRVEETTTFRLVRKEQTDVDSEHQ